MEIRGADLGGDVTIALWIRVEEDVCEATGDLLSNFDPTSRSGWTLSTVASGGGYNSRGDQVVVAFGVDAGTEPLWTACGRPNPTSNYVSNSLTSFDGGLYAATTDALDPAGWAHVYRHRGGTEWEDLGQLGGGAARGVGPLLAHRGSLYAATWNYDWTTVTQGDRQPCRVYRLEDGAWEDCGQPGDSRRLFSLASFEGDIYVVGDDFGCHVYLGDQRWETVGRFPTYGHPMTVHEGRLLVGLLDPAGVRTYRSGSWADLGNPVADHPSTQIHALHVHLGRLHATTWPEGRIARWDEPLGWLDVGRPGRATEVNALASYHGKLYSGSIPWAEVHRLDDTDWTLIRRFHEPDRWDPIAVDEVGRSGDGDRRMREWARVTSLTVHDGQLFVSTGSSTSAAVDSQDPALGSVHAMRTGVSAWSRPLAPGEHRVLAVRRGPTVALWIDGREVRRATDAPDAVPVAAPLRVRRTPLIGDIRVFDRALEPAEIQRLHGPS